MAPKQPSKLSQIISKFASPKVLNFRQFNRKQWFVTSGFVAVFAAFVAIILAYTGDIPRTPQAWVILAPPLKQCESGNNYTINTGNGYYGAYQFARESWSAYAPDPYKGWVPSDAPPTIQDQAAYAYFLDAGLGPWPECGEEAARVYRSSTVATPKPAPTQNPQMIVDEVSCQRVKGWTYDPDSPNTNIEVHVYIDGAGYNTGATSVASPDINNNGNLPNAPTAGTHRFDWPIPARFLDGARHNVSTFAINIGTGENTVVGSSFGPCAAPVVATTPTQTVVNHDPQMVVDEVSCQRVKGWAYDPDSPNANIQVHVYIDGAGYNTGATSVASPDINNNGNLPNAPTAGTHRFDWPIPAMYRNGVKHNVSTFGINIGAGGNKLVGSSFGPCAAQPVILPNSPTTTTTQTQAFSKTISVVNQPGPNNQGLCLDVPGNDTRSGTKLILWGCNNQINQKWSFLQNGTITIYGSRCLDVPGGSLANGNKIQIWACVPNSPHQKWRMNSDNTITPTGLGIAGLKKCLDIKDINFNPGAQIQLWDCNGGPNQKWKY